MDNYICINGNKTELTTNQLEQLGIVQKPKPLAAYTVEEISCISRSGKARELFKVHDILIVDDEECEIIGIGQDADSEGCKDTITFMRRVLLPERRMHSGACDGGWRDTELRAYLNGEFFESLPAELAEHIRFARKISHDFSGARIYTNDRIFIPPESEMFGCAFCSDKFEGERYEAFLTREERKRYDEDGDSVWYWLRSLCASSYSGSAALFASVAYGGTPSCNGAVSAFGVPVCFLI